MPLAMPLGYANPPVGHPHHRSEEEITKSIASPAPKEEPMPTAAAQKYADLKKKIADARKQMEDTAKGLFTEMSADLFNENPTLMSYSWTQYTPYFNDGDECVFRCQGDYPTVSILVNGDLLGYDSNYGEVEINGEKAESAENLLRKFKEYSKDLGADSFTKNGKTYAYDAKTNTVTKDGVKVPTYDENRQLFAGLEKVVGKFLGAFEDDDMKTMFGDHMRVTVKRDGTIETDEYQHD